MVLEVGSSIDHTVFFPSHYLPSLVWIHFWLKNCPPSQHLAPQEKLFGAFTEILYLEIIVDVIRQELKYFTGNFPHKPKNVFNSTTVVFFQPQLMCIFLSKGTCFMYKLASALFMLNLCNQYNNERNDSLFLPYVFFFNLVN